MHCTRLSSLTRPTQTQLRLLTVHVDTWTDAALRLFARHGLAVQTAHQADMQEVNSEVGRLAQTLRERMSSEGGATEAVLGMVAALEDTVLPADGKPADPAVVADRLQQWCVCVCVSELFFVLT